MRISCKSGLCAIALLLATTSTAHSAFGDAGPGQHGFFNAAFGQLFGKIKFQSQTSLAGNGAGKLPSLVTHMGATYAVTSDISAGVDLRHTSRVHTDAGVGYSSTALLDLNLSWKISRRWHMVGRLRSVAADAFALDIGVGSAKFGVPRTGDIALEYRF